MPIPLTSRNKKRAFASNLVETLQQEADFTEVIPAVNIKTKVQDLLNLAASNAASTAFPLCQVMCLDSELDEDQDEEIGANAWKMVATLRGAALFTSEEEATNWMMDTSDLLESVLLHSDLMETIMESLVEIRSNCEIASFPKGNVVWYMAGFVTDVVVTVDVQP